MIFVLIKIENFCARTNNLIPVYAWDITEYIFFGFDNYAFKEFEEKESMTYKIIF